MQTKELLEKPKKVVHAIKMLYLIIGIGVIRTIMTVMRHADVRSPYFLIVTKFLIYAVSLFLIYQIGEAKNWARWSMVVIFVIITPLIIMPNFDALSHNPIHSLMGILSSGLYIVALVFLFHESSSDWFGGIEKVSEKQ
jgi:hypothetical protein